MKNSKRFPVGSLITALTVMLSLCLGIMVMDSAKAQSVNDSASTKAKSPALARYTRDLTKLARQGKLETGKGHEAAVRRVIQIFSRSQQNNPVLVGEDRLNSTAVVEGLAQRIATGRVPKNLSQTRVYSLSLDALLAGVKTTEELQGRLQAVLSEASSEQGNSILFVDALYQFVGKHAEQTVSDTLTEATVGGKVRLIGATSRGAYDEYIAGVAALDSLFQQVNLDDLKSSETSENEDANKGSDAGEGSSRFKGEKISPDLRKSMESAGSQKGRVSVILQVDDVRSAQLNDLFARYGVKVSSRMSRLGTLKVEVPVKALKELAASNEVYHLSADREVRAFGHVTATTGADAVRQQTTTSPLGEITNYKLDGSGIGIAVLDSGVDTDHESFLALDDSVRVVFSEDFTGENRTDDPYGHGTHVAATAAGNGRIANAKYTGIAPNADIINLRVLNETGAGSVSGLLSALEWVMDNRTTYNIRVVNMSLGMLAVDSYQNDPICNAVRSLVDAGVVVVAAAGNNGKNSADEKVYGQVHSPGIEPAAITVGATNTFGTNGREDDVVTTYSSRGPTRGYWTDTDDVKHFDNLIKPDLVAPGNKLISAEADNNLLVTERPELDAGVSDIENRRQMYLNGTSMATPVVAGTAALLLQVNPNLTPNMVKMIMSYTAQQLAGFNSFEQGAGAVNIKGSVRLAKLVRTDLLSTTPAGDPLLIDSTPPTPETTIAGQTFTWSQGIIMNHNYATGTDLITMYQKIYDLGVLLADGVLLSDGVLISDGVFLSDGVLLGDNIVTSDGVLMGDGTLFCSNTVLMGDGVLISDGVLMGDGVLISDGVLLGDGTLLGDAILQAQSAAFGGDATASMEIGEDNGVDCLEY